MDMAEEPTTMGYLTAHSLLEQQRVVSVSICIEEVII